MTQIKTIAFFNNKGGVGKTTLACNFASWLSRKHDKKVIVIDCDPQANATQLSLSNEQWDNIYEDINRSDSETLLHVFQHFIEAMLQYELITNFTKRKTSSIQLLQHTQTWPKSKIS